MGLLSRGTPSFDSWAGAVQDGEGKLLIGGWSPVWALTVPDYYNSTSAFLASASEDLAPLSERTGKPHAVWRAVKAEPGALERKRRRLGLVLKNGEI